MIISREEAKNLLVPQGMTSMRGYAIETAIDEIYDAHETEIAELETERDKYNTIAANLQISRQKAYDNIAELEAIIEKMKCCENCKSHTNVGSNCLLDMDDSLDCRANNYSNWKLKDKK